VQWKKEWCERRGEILKLHLQEKEGKRKQAKQSPRRLKKTEEGEKLLGYFAGGKKEKKGKLGHMPFNKGVTLRKKRGKDRLFTFFIKRKRGGEGRLFPRCH